ncbi:MAG TPA: AAA family ATPase [Polyangiaceae bacterium]|nr:AAA family ATPase [Polyangiaceae bacterium]
MDDRTLDNLTAALAATPDNTALSLVIARAHLDRGEGMRALAVLKSTNLAGVTQPADRELAARIFAQAGEAEQALVFSDGQEPSALLVRARVLHSLSRTEEAVRLYRSVVATNPTLEDLELAALLASRAVRPNPEGPLLRVISNDDTNAQDALRALHPPTARVLFADVGGLGEVKRQIEKRIILPFTKPSLFQRFKKRAGGGILLYGPPGCGKTLLARATAGECGAQFFNVAISDVLDMYIGESERKLRAIFDKARASTPAVLFFDELEALAGKRQYSREATSSKLVSQFLSEMDGFSQNNKGVLILGATNVPWAVDPAFRRPGRFDRVLFVPPPDRDARVAILQRLLDARPTVPGLDVRRIAESSSGFSGADLENIVETASDEAIEESLNTGKESPISAVHLETARAEVKPTTLEWLTTARNYARYSNEAGQYDDVLEFLRKHGKS